MSSGMQSFYGGPNGQSFQIKKIFNTRVEMEKDVTSKGWASSVGVDEYVLISYGHPSVTEPDGLGKYYERYRDIDLEAYGATYNSTIWQKKYNESAVKLNKISGLYYQLVTSLTGFTPHLIDALEVINPNEEPKFEIYLGPGYDEEGNLIPETEKATVDEPIIFFHLPRASRFYPDEKSRIAQYAGPLDADEPPNASITETSKGDYVIRVDLPQSQVWRTDLETLEAEDRDEMLLTFDESDINHPLLTFHMPRTWDINLGVITVINPSEEPRVLVNQYPYNQTQDEERDPSGKYLHIWIPRAASFSLSDESRIGSKAGALDADQQPDFVLTKDDEGNYTFRIDLPQAQLLQEGITTIEDADYSPSFDIDSSDINRPVLNFSLPQAQIQDDPLTEWVGPGVNVGVELDDSDINHPKYTFHLPRAIKFFAGDLLGEIPSEGDENRFEVDLRDLPEEILVGDYYIHSKSGLIYVAIDTDNPGTMAFRYLVNFQASAPRINSTTKNPFKPDLTRNPPTATRSYTDDPSEPWQIDFTLPEIPLVSVKAEFIGNTETGSATVEPVSEDTIEFKFQVPSGTRIYAGTALTGENQLRFWLEGSHLHDLYLNTDTGIMYEQIERNVWMPQKGSLKGPVGDALNVTERYFLYEPDDGSDTEENTLARVIEKYEADHGEGAMPDPDEIIAVTWKVLKRDDEDQVITGKFDYRSYWYYCAKKLQKDEITGEEKVIRIWGRALLTGSAVGFIADEYVEEAADRTYSINYINDLIGGNFDVGSNRKAFSKDQIVNLLSWGIIGSGDNAGKLMDASGEREYDPGKLPESKDTLSVDETIYLMSWGSLAELAL